MPGTLNDAAVASHSGAADRFANKPLGHAQIADLNTAAVNLPSIPTGTVRAIVTAETAVIRWRDDGTAPTATTGHIIAISGSEEFWGDQVAAVQLIESGGTATAEVSYYGHAD